MEAAEKTCSEVVIVKPQDYVPNQSKTKRLQNISEHNLRSRSPSPQRLSSKSLTGSPSRSPACRSPDREMSPMQSSSLSTSLGKTRLYDCDPETVSKKSKRDIGDLVERKLPMSSYQRQESHEYMDTDDTDNYLKDFQRSEIRRDTTEMSKCKSSVRNITQWDTCDLRQIASFKLEVQVVSIVEKILTLLKNVKMRGKQTASVTTLDKLIFEVEGLVSQSVTESGKKMKEEIEKQHLPPKLMDDLLR